MTATRPTPTPDGTAGAPIDWALALSEHDRRLRIAVGVRLGEPQAIDEVMQEVALAAVEQRAPLAEPSKVGAWLHRLAIRQSLLYRRRMGRQGKLIDRFARQAGAGGEARSAPDPLEWLLSIERSRAVREALATLPDRDVEILLLKYTEDWTYRRLAAHLGVAETAVEARLHRARRRLRDALARPGESEERE